jgi:hypothetical protein
VGNVSLKKHTSLLVTIVSKGAFKHIRILYIFVA